MAHAILMNKSTVIKPPFEEVADTTVSGAATTTISLTGLNFSKDDVLLMEVDVDAAVANGTYIYFNGNTTNTNYYTQRFEVTSTTITAGERTNTPIAWYGQNRSKATIYIKLTEGGYITWISNVARSYSNSGATMLNDHAGTSTFTATSITSIQLTCASANGLGIGTRVQLFKLKADKVFDTTISGSATTNVDITGLSIDKDSEYLLISDILNPVASTLNYRLAFNANYTATDYYSQAIYCYGTTNQASRVNSPRILDAEASSRSMIMTRIKLSNNGYITAQAQAVRRYNSGSAMLIDNNYIVSTFTATSISSLRFYGVNASQVGIGSRFMLYKLK